MLCVLSGQLLAGHSETKEMATVTVASSTPEQGQLVRVRSRQWVVNEVKPSSLPPPAMKLSFDGAQHLLTLASVEDDGLGEELQVVWEVEPGAKVIEKVALPMASGCDGVPVFRATYSEKQVRAGDWVLFGGKKSE